MSPLHWPELRLPIRYEPELKTVVQVPPSGDEWLDEIKFDGYRFGCRIDAGKVNLSTRRGHNWTAKLPHIVISPTRQGR